MRDEKRRLRQDLYKKKKKTMYREVFAKECTICGTRIRQDCFLFCFWLFVSPFITRAFLTGFRLEWQSCAFWDAHVTSIVCTPQIERANGMDGVDRGSKRKCNIIFHSAMMNRVS